MKRRVAIVVGVVAAAIAGAGILYEYEEICCAPPRIPLDQYWFNRVNAAHHGALPEHAVPNE